MDLPTRRCGNAENASPDHEVFHCLDQPALDVASGGGLDSCVNETLPPSHSVEEQLLHMYSVIRFLTAHMRLFRLPYKPLQECGSGPAR